MNFFKRFIYRLIREYYRIQNKRYYHLYLKKAHDIDVFVPQITKSQVYEDRHIQLSNFPLPAIVTDRSLVIHIPYGGLGDHLLYSHIPRLAKLTGKYSKVYFSSNSLIRNENHLEYIWRKNPFLDGFCNDSNYHDYNSREIALFDYSTSNILDQIMLSYGIDDGKRWHDPELYFKVPIFPQLKGKSVFDPNFISYSGGINSQKIENYFNSIDQKINYQFQARSTLSLPVINFDSFIKDQNFEDFCGILVSCDKLYALTTGTATLAAALRKPTTVFHGKKIDKYFLHSKLHTYVNIALHQ